MKSLESQKKYESRATRKAAMSTGISRPPHTTLRTQSIRRALLPNCLGAVRISPYGQHLAGQIRKRAQSLPGHLSVPRYALLGHHALETACTLRLTRNLLRKYLGRFQQDALPRRI